MKKTEQEILLTAIANYVEQSTGVRPVVFTESGALTQSNVLQTVCLVGHRLVAKASYCSFNVSLDDDGSLEELVQYCAYCRERACGNCKYGGWLSNDMRKKRKLRQK